MNTLKEILDPNADSPWDLRGVGRQTTGSDGFFDRQMAWRRYNRSRQRSS